MTDEELTIADLPQPEFDGTIATDELQVDGDNPNTMPPDLFETLKDRMLDRGWISGPILADTDGLIADGQHRWEAAQEIGLIEVPVKQYDVNDAGRRILRQEANKIRGDHDDTSDRDEWAEIITSDKDRGRELTELIEATEGRDTVDDLLGSLEESTDLDSEYFDEVREPSLDIDGDHGGNDSDGPDSDDPTDDDRDYEPGSISRDFVIPPFSVLDTRKARWKTRQNEWNAIGLDDISTTLGRDGGLTGGTAFTGEWINDVKPGETGLGANSNGTSSFNPVLSEISVRWFSPADATILDPFAGGPARGVVSSVLSREYYGVDLRESQVEANREFYSDIDTTLSRVDESSPSLTQDTTTPTWVHGDSVDLPEVMDGHNDLPDKYDFVFSCPPYHDLEQYTDDPDDLSNMEYDEFIDTYRQIIQHSADRLKENRFAAFVVGDIRDDDGYYRDFIGDTIDAFEDAGMRLYNNAVVVTELGSLPIRLRQQFDPGRKLGKHHEHLLVFYKGDPAPQAIGEELGDAVIPDTALPGADTDAAESDGEWTVETAENADG